MTEQQKIYRVFQLLARLRMPLGVSKKEIAQDFEISERTIDRYFNLLRDLGFEILKQGGNRYKIEKVKPCQQFEDHIVFSIEEAAVIRDAILADATPGPLQRSLISKLYTLTDLEEVAKTISSSATARIVRNIQQAIKQKNCIILKQYQSLNHPDIEERLIEPIRFYNYRRYLLAYEIDSQKLKQYKTERITDALYSSRNWQNEQYHGNHQVDLFGMSGKDPIRIKLALNERAYRLLTEEFPDARPHCKEQGGHFLFEGYVFSLEGIGRFIMGLIDQVEIIEPTDLKNYIQEKIEGYLQFNRA